MRPSRSTRTGLLILALLPRRRVRARGRPDPGPRLHRPARPGAPAHARRRHRRRSARRHARRRRLRARVRATACAPRPTRALDVLAARGSALDAAVAGTVWLEDDPRFNAGTGANIRLDGHTIQMDAAVMTDEGRFAAVGAIERVKNPVRVARAVMDSTPHLFLVGEGATRFAHRIGFADVVPASPQAEAKYRARMKRQAELFGAPRHHDLRLAALLELPRRDARRRARVGPARRHRGLGHARRGRALRRHALDRRHLGHALRPRGRRAGLRLPGSTPARPAPWPAPARASRSSGASWRARSTSGWRRACPAKQAVQEAVRHVPGALGRGAHRGGPHRLGRGRQPPDGLRGGGAVTTCGKLITIVVPWPGALWRMKSFPPVVFLNRRGRASASPRPQPRDLQFGPPRTGGHASR